MYTATQIDPGATQFTRSRYNTVASFYDVMELGMESARFKGWRAALWRDVRGPRVLEIGVGTGKNIPYHPDGVQVTGIDLSEKMLARARKRAQERGDARIISLQMMDAQALAFEDASFDEVVATFVFCSVPDPVLGLKEALRVTKPGGRLLMLEHMLAEPQPLAKTMTLLDSPFHWMTGVHIARRTVENVAAAGWQVQEVAPLSFGSIFRRIIAIRPD